MGKNISRQTNLLKTIIAATPGFLILKDLNFIYQFVNSSFCRFLDKSEKDIIGKSDFDLFPANYAKAYRKSDTKIIKTRESQSEDWEVNGAKGKLWFHVTKTPVLDEFGQCVGVLCSVNDITGRKQAEEKLKRHTHDLVKRVKELGCLYRIDELGRAEDVSILRLLEETALLIPKSWRYPKITEGRIIFEGEEFKTKTFTKTEWQQTADIIINQKKAGAIEVYYTKPMPEADEGPFLKEERDLIDSMASRISGIIQRRLADKALKEERWRLESILKGTNIGTWEWNVQSGETVFNDRWAEVIGYSLDEISPVSKEVWTKFIEPEDLRGRNELLNKHFSGEQEYYEYECRMKHKDGYWIWVLDKGKVFSWTSDGKPLMMFGTHQDITEQKRVELALRESEERLQQFSEIDELTGLLNRRGWNESVAAEENRAVRYGQQPCVIVLDLEGINEIIDEHGQEEGYDLIRRIALNIQKAVRNIDKVARIGVDKFAILGIECKVDEAKAIMKRIETALSAEKVEASWGIAVYDSSTGLKNTMVEAERLMYKMKEKRRKCPSA